MTFLTDIMLQALAAIEESSECSNCGRCVILGPPCCEVRAAEQAEWERQREDERLRTFGLHPDQIAERRKAKRARIVARRAARREKDG